MFLEFPEFRQLLVVDKGIEKKGSAVNHNSSVSNEDAAIGDEKFKHSSSVVWLTEILGYNWIE